MSMRGPFHRSGLTRRRFLLEGANGFGALAATALFVVVVLGSIGPVANLLSSRQVMNTSFGRLHVVNTYGAFGSVGKERYELVFEGREQGSDMWRAYEFPCKPTSVDRRPCIITPPELNTCFANRAEVLLHLDHSTAPVSVDEKDIHAPLGELLGAGKAKPAGTTEYQCPKVFSVKQHCSDDDAKKW